MEVPWKDRLVRCIPEGGQLVVCVDEIGQLDSEDPEEHNRWVRVATPRPPGLVCDCVWLATVLCALLHQVKCGDGQVEAVEAVRQLAAAEMEQTTSWTRETGTCSRRTTPSLRC
eukprot:TRINITY_DN10498_c0_g1_i2.p2 TRINITY_DN10498_c0_g1~~TRINITY_DN10498_c0_g1_i2.p2  ORF type:complete len:114 (+),score=12.25 TRINITY_DN10498_c0_g1_i2:160-501(+)